MRTLFNRGRLVLVPESAEDTEQLASWKAASAGQVLALDDNAGAGLSIKRLGAIEEVCREPINVTSRHPDTSIRLIANFAETPFELDGLAYRSVESFWQGLKAADPVERRRIAESAGSRVKADLSIPPYGATLEYNGVVVAVGTWAHWQLMQRACSAKFAQHADARAALVATGTRPLVHRVRRDSTVIPGVIMADIWMRIRARLLSGSASR